MSSTVIELPQFDLRDAVVHIQGTSSLVCHAWDEKQKKQMLDKQMKRASTGKVAKDPEADYLGSLYRRPDGTYGFPSIAFKSAAVTAGKYADAKMTFLRGAFHIDGEFVTIKGQPSMREDMVRVGMGTADIRYRGEFKEWAAALPIRYNARAITLEQIINLFRIAGFGVGIGEWRPERDGQFGRFEVVGADEAKEVS